MIIIPDHKRGQIISDLMPDLTPLLDVMFMLIIFFILTANATPYVLDVNLPKDQSDVIVAADNQNLITVTLLANDRGWKINETIFTDNQAFQQNLIQKTTNETELMIIGDQSVSMEKLLNLMTFLRKHNIQTANIVMDKP